MESHLLNGLGEISKTLGKNKESVLGSIKKHKAEEQANPTDKKEISNETEI